MHDCVSGVLNSVEHQFPDEPLIKSFLDFDSGDFDSAISDAVSKAQKEAEVETAEAFLGAYDAKKHVDKAADAAKGGARLVREQTVLCSPGSY